MENAFASYEGISASWIEKCTFISGIVAIALPGVARCLRHQARRIARTSPVKLAQISALAQQLGDAATALLDELVG